jgi:hypothetical protein
MLFPIAIRRISPAARQGSIGSTAIVFGAFREVRSVRLPNGG